MKKLAIGKELLAKYFSCRVVSILENDLVWVWRCRVSAVGQVDSSLLPWDPGSHPYPAQIREHWSDLSSRILPVCSVTSVCFP